MSLDEIWRSIPPEALGWVTAMSVATFLVSLVLVPVVVTRIPANYFHEDHRQAARLRRVHPLAWLVVKVVKNALAFLFVVGGIVMLVLPGQGILTILIGIGLSDFPGKYRLERRLVSIPGILGAINWIRQRAGVEPLRPPG